MAIFRCDMGVLKLICQLSLMHVLHINYKLKLKKKKEKKKRKKKKKRKRKKSINENNKIIVL